jgi:uncharacterized CHY-type Zn-finger protein
LRRNERRYKFSIGDKVIKIKDERDSELIEYNKEYTVIQRSTQYNTRYGCYRVLLRGHGVTRWWTNETCLKSTIKGICRNCINTCRIDGKEECPFFEGNNDE